MSPPVIARRRSTSWRWSKGLRSSPRLFISSTSVTEECYHRPYSLNTREQRLSYYWLSTPALWGKYWQDWWRCGDDALLCFGAVFVWLRILSDLWRWVLWVGSADGFVDEWGRWDWGHNSLPPTGTMWGIVDILQYYLTVPLYYDSWLCY